MSAESTFPVHDWMHPEVQYLRKNAGSFLNEISDRVGELGGEPRALTGGIISACYLLRRLEESSLVAKFSVWASPSEGEMLAHWGDQGVKVPQIHEHGFVSSTKDSEIPISYILMEAKLDSSGSPLPVADKVITEDLFSAQRIGLLLGKELAKIHETTVEGLGVGSEHIIDEFHNPSQDWNQYLQNEVTRLVAALEGLGYDSSQIATMLDAVGSLPYDREPSYLHNDPSPTNVLVSDAGDRSCDICIIDPNPLIGDIHWDMAHLANKAAWAQIQYSLYGDTETVDPYRDYYLSARTSYEKETGFSIEEGLLLGCQLPRSLKSLAWFIHMSDVAPRELEIAKGVARDQADRLLKLS